MKNERLPGFNAESSLHKIDEDYLSYYYRVREQSTIIQQARTVGGSRSVYEVYEQYICVGRWCGCYGGYGSPDCEDMIHRDLKCCGDIICTEDDSGAKYCYCEGC